MKPIQNGIQPRRPQISAATASPGVPCCDIGCIDIGCGCIIGYMPYGCCIGGEYGASALFDGMGGGVGTAADTIVGEYGDAVVGGMGGPYCGMGAGVMTTFGCGRGGPDAIVGGAAIDITVAADPSCAVCCTATCCAGGGRTGANDVAPYESTARRFPHLGHVVTVSATMFAQRGHCTRST